MDSWFSWRALDLLLFQAIYDLGVPTIVAEAITHVATKGGVWAVIGLTMLAFGRGRNRRTGAAIALGLVVHVLLLEAVIKHAVARPRPFVTLGLVLRDALVDPASFSFPSGHSAASFLGAWVLGSRFPRLRVPLLCVAGLVALSRVQLGAHYPTDVICGALFGLILGVAMVRLFRVADDGLETNPETPVAPNAS